MAVQTQMQVRRGTAASWTSTNPTLAAGEWGLETDTGKTKIGDGSTAWASLAYTDNIVAAGTGISVSTSGKTATVTNTMATAIDAKGDLVAGTGADTFSRLAAGTNEHRLVADSAQSTGLKYVADTTNYAIGAKGDLLVGTAADTVTAITVGADGTFLTADSTQASGVKWTTIASGSSDSGGIFRRASGTNAGSYTYTVSVPAGGAELRMATELGYAGIVATFGTSAYSTFTWTTQTTTKQTEYTYISVSSPLTSVTINTSPSGFWNSRVMSSGFGTSIPTMTNITFGNSTYVLTGTIGSNPIPYYATSTDAVTWTSRNGNFGTSTSVSVGFGNGIFVGVDSTRAQINTSTDGITWTTRSNPSAMANGKKFPAIYINGLTTPWYIMSGTTALNSCVSTDGITWTTRNINATAAGISGFAGHNNFATAKIVAMLEGQNYYYSSTDGVTWTSRPFGTTTTNTSGAGSRLATDGSKYIFVNYQNLYNSTDGITWTVVESGVKYGANTTNWQASVYYNATPDCKWVMPLYDASLRFVINSSTDGVTWYNHNTSTAAGTAGAADSGGLVYGSGIWTTMAVDTTSAIMYYDTTGNGTLSNDIIGTITTYPNYTTLS